ncbi:MAG: VOC family protein [Acetobacteraceae bacterium]|nr:VOC family protein [Acetobacteraceae bacterium]
MPQPIPYLAFNGSCTDAMRFYAEVLGGKLSIMTNRRSPFADRCPPEHLDRVMYAQLELEDGVSLYAGDRPPDMPYQGIHGISIALNYDSAEKAQQVFDALATGGTVTMPFSETFWARKFGMVTDRFGCHWMVNGERIDIRLAA